MYMYTVRSQTMMYISYVEMMQGCQLDKTYTITAIIYVAAELWQLVASHSY